jgi:aspartyl-tRNA(Asn)/glutamyl-tRNA(Gln) amidotransferase subunit A
LAEAARAIACGAISPVELVHVCLERIDRLDGRVHAFLALDREGALAAARRAEQHIRVHGPIGPLHGIPVGLKDVFETRVLPTTAHSRLLMGNVAGRDSAVAARLDAAGAILLGKLATHEFALGGPSFDLPWPPARNPWDLARFTGGSSSGPAAAVAAGMVLLAVGSDTAGSIRSPAAHCGVAGLKPSFGRVSRVGMVSLAPSLDHAGPMAWTAEDCALALAALEGLDENDPASRFYAAMERPDDIERRAKGVRIGVLRRWFEIDRPASRPQLDAIGTAIELLRALGAEVRDVEVPALADWHAAGSLIILNEAFERHRDWLRTRPEQYGEATRDRFALGAFVSDTDYAAAIRRGEELVAALRAASGEIDVLLGVSQPGEAPLFDAMAKWDGFETPGYNVPFNLSGDPAITVCCGFGPNGMPLGLQLAAKPGADAFLLRVAAAYERAAGWRVHRPSLV